MNTNRKIVKYIFRVLLTVTTLLFLQFCISPYDAKIDPLDTHIIVIEGDITPNDTTKIKISLTRNLDQLPDEKQDIVSAFVWVEDEVGNKYFGHRKIINFQTYYIVPPFNYNINLKYKLCLNVTSNFSEIWGGGNNVQYTYESELLKLLVAPPIESIDYKVNEDKSAVTFFVNSNDPSNNTTYYKWSFREDWEFKSLYMSYYEYNPFRKEIVPINSYEDNRHICWSFKESSSILIFNTEALAEDRVHMLPLVSMGKTDLRTSYLYSMNLKQMAISKEAYKFWDNLKKNSEEIGGIFDPQPSEVSGNIKCISHPGKRVIGYISAGLPSYKRIFAKGKDIGIYKHPSNCGEMVVTGSENPLSDEWMYLIGYDIIGVDIDFNGGAPEKYWIAIQCVDCRLFGTKEKPSYWPNIESL